MRTKLTIQEKGLFCNEIAIILSSGMNILEGLEIIYPELPNELLKTVTQDLIESYQNTGHFYDALIKNGCFDTYMEEMVKIGEESGHLDDVMHQLALYYERNDDMAMQLKDALTYPLILMVMMIAVIGLLIVKILPVFQGVLYSLGTSLSPFAMTMMNFGEQFAFVSFVVLLIIIMMIVAFYIYTKLYPQNTLQGHILSRFFATKKLYLHISMANITYALSLFMLSGYPSEEALRFLPAFVKHPLLSQKVNLMIQDIDEGMSFEETLHHRGLYEGMYSHLLQIGFKSGRQDEVMKQLVGLYEKDVSSSISSFLNIIEPTIVALLSFVVGIILLSVMLPLISIMSSL